MACEFYINGKSNPTHNSVLNYISDTSPARRSADKVMDKLVEGGIVFKKANVNDPTKVHAYLTKSPTALQSINHVKNLNTMAQTHFGLPTNRNLVEVLNADPNMENRDDKLYEVAIDKASLKEMDHIDPDAITRSKETADEIAALLSGPTSPYSAEYERIKKLRQSQADQLISKNPRLKKLEDQTVRLKRAFKAAGVETEVIFDSSLESKGQISLEDGVPTVRINPDLMSEDTVYHEFGHLYVDLLGYNHPAVQALVAELKDTVLAEEVMAKYPELFGEMLNKEIIVTAIGLEGAKIERNKPSKWQQLLNKLFRALGNLLGVTPNTAAKLAEEMFAGSIRAAEFRGSLAPYVQKSKAERNVEDVLDSLRVKIQSSIIKLESSPNPNDQLLMDLKLQKERLEKVESVQDLLDFVNYVTRYVATAEATMENVERNYNQNLSQEDRLNMMREIHEIGEWIGGFHNTENSTLNELTKLLEDRKFPNNGGSQADLDAFIGRLVTAMRTMDRLQESYMDKIVYMQVDLMLEYHRPEVNNSLDQIIENIQTNKRLIGINKRDPEYQQITDAYLAKKITKADYDQSLLDLNVKQLQSRKIGRETLVTELKEAQKNKKWASYMMDPMIYSSQNALQLFTLQVKNSLYAAADKSRETQYALKDLYREYAVGKDGWNDAKFNEPILEEHTYYVTDWAASKDGKIVKKAMKLQTFVQPFKVGEYNEAEFEITQRLNTKYNRPESADALKAWSKTADGKRYYKELSTWYKNNTEAVPDAQKEHTKMLNKLAALRKDSAQAIKANRLELAGIFDAQIAELEREITSVYDKYSKTYRGRLTQPSAKYKNPKYEKLAKDKNSIEWRYYQALMNEYHKSQDKLGKTNQVKNSWDRNSYVLPTVRKEALDKVIEGQVRSAGKDMLQDTFQIMETDIEYGILVGLNGERLQTVPVFFTNPVESEHISQDAVGSILRFAHMANMFEEKSKIQVSVESMRTIIENRGTIEESPSGIPGVSQAARMLKDMKNKVIKQDGKRDPDNHLRQLNAFIDTVFYGEQDLKANVSKTITIFGKTFNVNFSSTKVARAIALLTSSTSLAFNKLQAVNQAVIDNERLIEEAAAHEFFGAKNLAWANKELAASFLTLQDNAAKDINAFAADSKLFQAADMFDALSEFTDRFGMDVSGNRIKKAMNLGTSFMYQNLAEYQTALTRMLALMDAQTGKLEDKDGNVIMNDKGKPANLWDVLIKDEKGMYIVDPKVANFDIGAFRNTLSGVQKKSNQLKHPADKTAAERTAVGKLAMIFRKYLVPGFRRRFGHGGIMDMGYLHIDQESGVVSQGMYYSFMSYLSMQAKGLVKGNPQVWNMLSKEEKANVIRTTLEVAFGITAMLMYRMLSEMAADEDDEDTKASLIFWAYQARRLNTELAQFRSKEAIKALKSPTAAVRPLTNIADLIDHMLFKELPYALTGNEVYEKDIFYSRKAGKYEKGDRKLWRKLEKGVPLWSGLNKDAEQAIKWFDLQD